MPIETVPGTGVVYYLIVFDADGRERTDDPAGSMSQRAVEALGREPYTDVFLFSHGWQSDVPSARDQFNRWIATMLASPDLQRIRQREPGFRPFLVGLHWPSLPWGNEDLSSPSFAVPGAVTPSASPGAAAVAAGSPAIANLVDAYAARLAQTPAARQALETIFRAALDDPAPTSLPLDVRDAYAVLNRESGLGNDGPGAPPGEDRERFDPEQMYQSVKDEEASFGGFDLGGLLAPLRLLSFFKMKDRGRSIGEGGGHTLLRWLQEAAPGARFHLMGHSFGCVVVSAILGGPDGTGSLVRPVDSVMLVQGALSFWSYCSEIPFKPRRPGYFHSIVSERKVRGPILTTRTPYDTAVGRLYPLAAGVAGQVAFATDELPKYGALGSYGIRGPGPEIVDLPIKAADEAYGFEAGKVYDLECSGIIREGPPPAGAHGDFLRPEVAHAVWEAARV